MHQKLVLLEQHLNASPLVLLPDPWLKEQGIALYIKRDDLLHPVISGNKWRKLKYILQFVLSNSYTKVISMGGAYSNHLHALAYIGLKTGIQTQAFIRGEQMEQLNPSLMDMQRWGMQFDFISRTDYRQLRHYKQPFELPGLQQGAYWLPEGGALLQALSGVQEIVQEIEQDFDYFCVPCGTGTTMAGIVSALTPDKTVLGFSALKGATYLNHEVAALLAQQNVAQSYAQWQINHTYHFGGFAKSKPELIAFMHRFNTRNHIALDRIYTGKMFYAIYELIKNGFFKPGQRIIALHTGGLQGNRGFADG